MDINRDKAKEYYPEAKMIEAMKINKIPTGKEHLLSSICEGGEYFAQLKKDGYFYEFEKTEHYSYLFSRNVSVTTECLAEKGENVPHIVNALNVLPKRTILIGEIYYPKKTSKAVTEIMGCLADKAIERQNNTSLIHYYIHDIIYYDGYNLLDVGAEIRYKILEKIFYLHGLDKYDFLELAKVETENIEEKINEALANGEEGMVLKKKTSLYTPAKRPAWETIKIKKVDYADVIIADIVFGSIESSTKEPETWKYWAEETENEIKKYEGEYFGTRGMIPITKWYYLGMKTTIILSAFDDKGELKEIGRIKSGISDSMIYDMNENPDKYINHVAEIQCMQLDKKEHTIRHGFFKRMRDDKNLEDCTLKNIF